MVNVIESTLTQGEPGTKIVSADSTTKLGNGIITTRTPVFMFDAKGTTITIVDPTSNLDSEEEQLYKLQQLSSSKPNDENKNSLFQIIRNLGLYKDATEVMHDQKKKGRTPQQIYYALIDIISRMYCESIGDPTQEKRIDVLLKTHSLIWPGIFESLNDYACESLHSNVSQVILTQDDSIMRDVYKKVLKREGCPDLNIITVPEERFEFLRKDNPRLYSLLAAYFSKDPNQMGLYDDKEINLKAARDAGLYTKLASGTNDSSKILQEVYALADLLCGKEGSVRDR